MKQTILTSPSSHFNPIGLAKLRTLSNWQVVMLTALMTLATILLGQMLSPGSAHAATIVPDGTICTLDEAIASISAGSNQSGCTGTGTYGTNDTIDLPAGVFTTSGLPISNTSATVTGQGMGQTIIDAGDANEGLLFVNVAVNNLTARVENLSIRNVGGTDIALSSYNYSLDVNLVEIYSNTASPMGGGILTQFSSPVLGNMSSTISNVYIHDVEFSNSSAVAFESREGSISTGNVLRNNTVSDVEIGAGFASAAIAFGDDSSIELDVQNNTFVNNEYTNVNGSGAIAAYSDGTNTGSGDSTVLVTARNNTIVAGRTITTNTSALIALSLALSGRSSTASVESQNNLLVGDFSGTQEIGGCFALNVGVGGTENSTITSGGGNVFDDSSSVGCLTEPTDQSGVTDLASTLGPLQDNDGTTLTMALLTGSPAIDSGVVNGLSTDQRGIARPQGLAFDSGAYELASVEESEDDVSPVAEDDSLADTGTNIALLSVATLSAGIGSVAILSRRRFLK